jgi:peptidoglycan/LPS O-acetylase OafA/YrhL
MIYRPEINGLRALAIIPVILFHSNSSFFSGGFLGVDVFFVISGYLMTSIIITEKKNNSFSFLNFYERRVRRLLPALYFVLLLSLILSIIYMLPYQIKEFGQSLFSSILFSSNIFFWFKTDYWSQSAELTPLIHTWSLSIEEQFYLLFPLGLVFFNSQKKIKIFLIIILVLSLGAFLYIRSIDQISESFYLLHFRMWELILGALAFFFKAKFLKKYDNYINLIALLLLIFSLSFFNNNTNSALLYLTPTFSIFLLLIYKTKDSLVLKILSNKVLVFIGTISYSLYLFHQPVFSFSRILNIQKNDNLVINVILIIIIFVLSYLSFKFVETPFRNKKKITTKKIWLLTIIISSFFLLSGITLHNSEGLKKFKYSLVDKDLKNTLIEFEKINKDRSTIWNEYSEKSNINFINNDNKKVLILGDSLSKDLFIASSINKNISNYQFRRVKFDDNCLKNFDFKTNSSKNQRCDFEITQLINSILLKKSDIIIIANDWRENAKHLESFLNLDILISKKIIIYKTHAFMDMSSFLIFKSHSKTNFKLNNIEEFTFTNRHHRTLKSHIVLNKIADKFNLKTINSFDFFCNDKLDRCNIFDENNIPLISDQTHLTNIGFIKFSPWFYKQLEKAISF